MTSSPDPRWNLFMETPPARLPAGSPMDWHRLVRNITIAATTAALVLGLSQLLFATVLAG